MPCTAPFFLVLAAVFAKSYGQTIQQSLSQQSVFQGMEVQLNCTYSGADYLFWYVQYPGQALEMLLSSLLNEENKGFSAEHKKSETSFNMKKDKAELQDSGVYFCAARDTVTQG
ncbi:hypothetical protein XELAEV_18000283mg [Xenopus laevis]|uniref:Ig-like domain-containing protein n=1 Tax=Xenopus laevis TaxID=8355 RepID=A0A974GZ97_XENLA|nr:hypothetical protein XELAEV_18000283mg [Xenopus laevis]